MATKIILIMLHIYSLLTTIRNYMLEGGGRRVREGKEWSDASCICISVR